MNLEKTLLQFYKKTIKLEKARLKFKELKKSFVKFNINENPDISEIQRVIEAKLKLKHFSDRTGDLPSELMRLQRNVIDTLKAIGIHGKKKILIEHSKFGPINFWYEGTLLYFEAVS